MCVVQNTKNLELVLGKKDEALRSGTFGSRGDRFGSDLMGMELSQSSRMAFATPFAVLASNAPARRQILRATGFFTNRRGRQPEVHAFHHLIA